MSCEDRSCDCACGCDGGCQGDCACAGACARATALEAPMPRPGLDVLNVRIGDYGRFLAAATQALSSKDAPALQALGTRDPADPAIALVDAWAVAADVLTFYRERLTNEGYLRCARDERSLRWLASEVGYKPRPGVAATAWLAYMMDANAAPVHIPVGAKAQTSPNGNEQMQVFETLEALEARYEWSAMLPRQTRMPPIDMVDALSRDSIKLAGTATAARPGERLIFAFGYGPAQQAVREIAEAKVDVLNGCVDVSLIARLSPAQASEAGELLSASQRLSEIVLAAAGAETPEKILSQFGLLVLTSFFLGGSATDAHALSEALAKDRVNAPRAKNAMEHCVKAFASIIAPAPPERVLAKGADIDSALVRVGTPATAQPNSARKLDQSALDGLASSGARRGALLKQASPQLDDRLYQAWRAMPANGATAATAPEVYILRTVTSPYGAAAPKKDFAKMLEWGVELADAQPGAAYLDSVLPNLARGSLALVDVPLDAVPTDAMLARVAALKSPDELEGARFLRLARVASTQVVGRGDYGLNGRVTRLGLVDAETGKVPLQVINTDKVNERAAGISGLRRTVYAVQSELVTLAEQPIDDADVAGSFIDMDSLLDGIQIGRWVIVQGERTDMVVNDQPLPGIVGGELALVAGVEQRPYPKSPGDTLHTTLTLAASLAYSYKRSTVKVYGNVVKASHGERVAETIGSGSAMTRLQQFALRRAPMTFLPAVTTSGVQGTQLVRVNNVRWKEVDSLLDAGSTERVYEMSNDASGVAGFTFGDGIHGARLPSGQGNVRATYRAGIGAVGNARAGQIVQLATRPLGVNSVVNPLAASGGADRDGSERIRANVPLATQSLSPLSRLVSVADYSYFARRYAGVGQAEVRKLSDGAFECIHVTLAGVGDAPLRANDDLVSSLREAYAAFGDPALPVVIDIRELVALFIQARVTVLPDYDWETVEPAIRGRLLDAFSFDRRRLAQSVYLSEVISAIQSVMGVDWVDLEVLGGLSEVELRDKDALALAVQGMQAQITQGSAQRVVHVRAADRATDAAGALSASEKQSRFVSAQVAYLMPDVPGTLVLNRA